MKLNKKIIKSFSAIILAFAMIFCYGFSNYSQALTTYYTLHFTGTSPIAGHDIDGFGLYVQFNRNLLSQYDKVRKPKTKTALYADNWTKKGGKYSATKKCNLGTGVIVVVGNTKKYNGVSYTQVQVPLQNKSGNHYVYTISNKFAKTSKYTGWVKTSHLKDLSGKQYVIGKAWYGTKYSTKNSKLYNAVLKNQVRVLKVSYLKNKKYLFLK